MRRGPSKKDSNHETIARTYRDLGCSVFDAHEVGNGFRDLVIGCCGITDLVEVKTETGTYTKAQRSFAAGWRGSHRTVRTIEDVCNHVAELRVRSSNDTAELLRDLSRALDRGSLGYGLRERLRRAIDADD